MTGLADKTCVPCKGDVPPLEGAKLEELSRQIPGWEVVDDHHLRRELRFKNFREALEFVNRVGELAEDQAHHPDQQDPCRLCCVFSYRDLVHQATSPIVCSCDARRTRLDLLFSILFARILHFSGFHSRARA